MDNDKLRDKIKGMFVTSGMGDALGAATEAWSTQEIIDYYGGLVTDFVDPSISVYVADNVPGEVTDDTSQTYEMALAIINSWPNFTVNAAAQALIDWSEKYPKYYPRNAGPTTRHVIEELKKGADPVELGKIGRTFERGTSNGAAMRIGSAGVVYPGDLDKTIDVAITMTKPSHGTQHAFSAAGAIACAVSNALTEEATLDSILESALYGAKKGEEIGRKDARIAYGFATYEKIELAAKIAKEANSMEEAMRDLERYVGNDGTAQISAATSIGLFLAAKGDSMKTIIGGANIGGDTDTIACIAGKIAGAYNGMNALDKELLKEFEEANPSFDYNYITDELLKIAIEN